MIERRSQEMEPPDTRGRFENLRAVQLDSHEARRSAISASRSMVLLKFRGEPKSSILSVGSSGRLRAQHQENRTKGWLVELWGRGSSRRAR
jgi:hypothetical protein